MNKKAQLDEVNPAALGLAVLGALVSMFIIKNIEIAMVWKIASPIVTFIACYFLVSFQTS